MDQSVPLTNGSAVELDHFQWTRLASQECDSLTATTRNPAPGQRTTGKFETIEPVIAVLPPAEDNEMN
jgi:hypothetical protein